VSTEFKSKLATGARKDEKLCISNSLSCAKPSVAFQPNLPMLPKFDRKRAVFVMTQNRRHPGMGKTEGKRSETPDLSNSVAILCKVRTGQYWWVEKLASFDEFVERRFPESRRKAH
jgi:hypothetical protein